MVLRIPETTFGRSTDLKRYLWQGTLGTLVLRAALLAVNLLTGVALARWLGPSTYGSYELVIAVVMLLALPSSIGIPSVTLREAAAAISRRDWRELSGLLIWSSGSVAVLSVLVAAFAGALASLFSSVWQNLDRSALTWGLLALPLLSVFGVCCQYLRGLHHTLRGQLPELLRQAALLCLILAAGFSSVFAPTASHALILYVLALTGGMALVAVFLRGNLPSHWSWQTAVANHPRWARMAMPFAMIGGIHLINSRADIMMLGAMTDTATVGSYAIAMRAAELVLFVPIALNIAMASSFSHLHATSDLSRLRVVVKRAVHAQTLCAVPIVALLVFFGESLVEFVFGAEYLGAVAALRVLALGHLVNVVTGPADLLLNMTGHERKTALGMAIAASLNIVLNILLIPTLGILGAALATAAATLTWNIALALFAYRVLAVNTTVLQPASSAL